MPLDFLFVGAEPMPGYQCVQDLGGSVFYRLWKVKAPDGSFKMWKAIDLVVGNAAVETRNLELLVKLRHPNLNTLTSYYTLEDLKTLIIETEVPIKSLRDRLNECKAMGLSGIPTSELYGFMVQAADGLDFLNSPRHQFQGQQVAIYHRDLRPESLLLFREEGKIVCKVSDFGLAKPVSEQNAQHSQGLLHFDYDPPEFYEGITTSTSDQYSLAINYYELRSGSLPFQGTMLEQLSARLSDSPNLSGVIGAERQILRKALSKEPQERFTGCGEFMQKLSNAAGAPAENIPAQRPTQRPASPIARTYRPAAEENQRRVPAAAGAGRSQSGNQNQGGAAEPYSPYEGISATKANGSTAVGGVTIRRPPAARIPPTYNRPPSSNNYASFPETPSVQDLEIETGEDLHGIVKGAAARRPESRAPAKAAFKPKPAPLEFQEKKVPFVWVVLILLAVFSAIAVLAREFIGGG